jgi:HPt (histidine-containing phosphotransfer) domain-containing protein
MSTGPATTTEIKLQALYDAFALHNPAKLRSIEDLRVRVGAGDVVAAQTLHREVHTLAGSAGTFGYSQLGDGAKALELAIEALIAQGALSRATLEPLAPLLDRLRQAAAIPDPPLA